MTRRQSLVEAVARAVAAELGIAPPRLDWEAAGEAEADTEPPDIPSVEEVLGVDYEAVAADEGMRRMYESEKATGVDGANVLDEAGITAGGIFGEGAVPTNLTDPAASARRAHVAASRAATRALEGGETKKLAGPPPALKGKP